MAWSKAQRGEAALMVGSSRSLPRASRIRLQSVWSAMVAGPFVAVVRRGGCEGRSGGPGFGFSCAWGTLARPRDPPEQRQPRRGRHVRPLVLGPLARFDEPCGEELAH